VVRVAATEVPQPWCTGFADTPSLVFVVRFRFIPDDMDLSARVVRDAATEVPQHYSPPDLFTGALQHTEPSLTWDETDKRRKKVSLVLHALERG
jgi:hypothetical protein